MYKRRRDNGERAASLVEFALILPLLTLLLLGTVTGGLALSRQNSVKNAVRETTRFAAVQADFTNAGASLDAMYAQVVAAATGDLDPNVDNRYICVALIDENNVWHYKEHTSSATPSASSPAAGVALASVPTTCKQGFDPAVAAGTDRVWVRASRTSNINAVLYNADWDIEARALTRYER